MSNPRTLYQVDSFTAEAFRGNPAGVCLLENDVDDDWMQAIAGEMNLSETAFVRRGSDHYTIRYFTPTVEVSLCGHATLASAHIMWQEGVVAHGERIPFMSKEGPLTASREGEWTCLDFPAYSVEPVDVPAAFGNVFAAVPDSAHMTGGGWHLLVFDSEQTVRGLRPSFGAMREAGIDGVAVTAPSGDDAFDFVSRFFAPGFGIDEDPVTGAAHCSLGPYWSGRLGKDEVVGKQVSHRSGVVRVRVRGDRVDLLGRAVSVFRLERVI